MKVLSLDVGASSGRFFIVEFCDGLFSAKEVYRFENGIKEYNGSLRWNFKLLFSEIKKGLRKALSENEGIKCLGVDTWAVDYGRLNKKGLLIDNPFAYRDQRGTKARETLLRIADYQDIYKNSGIQLLDFNTIFQLFSEENKSSIHDILLMPDLINFYLTGVKKTELTNLSTTALYNPLTRNISKENMKLTGFGEGIFNPIIEPSEFIGMISEDLCHQLGINSIPVVSVCSHDTASAVASIKLDNHTAYLSSGTWSLLGVEMPSPIINRKAFQHNFTNEIGFGHTVRFLKNIMGLFILQELKKEFIKTKPDITFQIMQDEAKKINGNRIYIDVDDVMFQQPGDMLNKYYAYLKKTKQFTGEMSVGEIVRSIYESLAFMYVEKMKDLCDITEFKIDRLVIVGGGNNSKLLNQLIADALGIKVITGESEATVYGNAIALFIYQKVFGSIDEARTILTKQTNKEIYMAKDTEITEQKYDLYSHIVKGGI